MVIVVLFGSVFILESKETRCSSSRPLTFSFITLSLEMTKGRALRLCGAIGVKTKLSDYGIITGPPQLNE